MIDSGAIDECLDRGLDEATCAERPLDSSVTVPRNPDDHPGPRIVYFGHYEQRWSTETYVARALRRLGCKVVKIEETTIDEAGAMEAISREHLTWGVDLVLFAKLRFTDWPNWGDAPHGFLTAAFCKRLEALGIRTASWTFDLMDPAQRQARWTWATACSRSMTRMFLTDGYTTPHIENAVTLRQGCPDDFDDAIGPMERYRCDVAFLGDLYADRAEWFATIGNGLAERRLWLRQFNNVRTDHLSALAASCKVILGPDTPWAVGYASNRIYIATGYGACYVAPDGQPYEQEGWQPGNDFFTYPHNANPNVIVNKLAAFCNERAANLRKIMAAKGRERCRRDFSYDERCKVLLRECDVPLPVIHA
jgi:hypothetical protein